MDTELVEHDWLQHCDSHENFTVIIFMYYFQVILQNYIQISANLVTLVSVKGKIIYCSGE